MNLQIYINTTQQRLTDAGIDTPDLDARLLFCHALKCTRVDLLSQAHRSLTDAESAAIEALIARRAAREPVARILGLREFWGLPFGLNEATLEPRPDSETLIENALKRCASAPPKRLLDLGTGTGCLLLSLLHEWPEAVGLGLDKAPRALEQAQENAQQLGLENRAMFRESNWLSALAPEDRFDLIVCNPPYIPSAEIPALQPEVRHHDPMAALDGGADGLDPYRHLIPLLPHHLNKGGVVLFEVGIHQAADVAALLQAHAFTEIQIAKDLGGVDRCVSGTIA